MVLFGTGLSLRCDGTATEEVTEATFDASDKGDGIRKSKVNIVGSINFGGHRTFKKSSSTSYAGLKFSASASGIANVKVHQRPSIRSTGDNPVLVLDSHFKVVARNQSGSLSIDVVKVIAGGTYYLITDELKAHQIQIGMDGKGRCLDNVFVERLWRTVKYEEVYLSRRRGRRH